LNDITTFLETNNIQPSTNLKQNYMNAWELIKSNAYDSAPAPISDFIIASNLSTSNIQLPPMKLLDILSTPDDNLRNLANQLNLPSINKERIVRILRYMNKLIDDISFLENLPDDVITSILYNLDCKVIPLICQLSNTLSNYCQRNLDNLLRVKLEELTGLQTNKYDRQQLLNLCRISPKYNNISGGAHSSLFLKNQQVYVCGINESGGLGLGDREDRDIPTLIPNLMSIVQISTGAYFSLLLSITGQIYACGDNYYRQLGLGVNDYRIIPTLISSIDNIVQISAGRNHSLCLSIDGEIYGFGLNNYGQLGLGDNEGKNIPTLISLIDNI